MKSLHCVSRRVNLFLLRIGLVDAIKKLALPVLPPPAVGREREEKPDRCAEGASENVWGRESIFDCEHLFHDNTTMPPINLSSPFKNIFSIS